MSPASVVGEMLVWLTRLVTGVQVRWAGCDPDERQRLYYANHTSHLDTMVIWSALPRHLRSRTSPVAAEDYWAKNALRRFLAKDVFHAVLIKRGGVNAGREALTRISEALGQGTSVIFFPEGTRGDGATVGAMKAGLYHIAKDHPGLELVPVYLQNLNRILPKGEILPVPLLGTATFGAPLPHMSDETREGFLERAKASLVELGSIK